MSKQLFIGLLLIISINQYAQCWNDTLTVGHDTTLCQGQTIQLKADSAYISYLWNTNSTNSSITVNSTGQYICTAKIVDSTSMVFNGDFELNFNIFTSNYIPGTGGTWGLLSSEGQYAISTNANLTHTNFANCTDHTSGSGKFMIVNGAAIANQHVWCQTIYVQPATDYIFSAWFTSVVASNPAVLNFTINGISIGPNVTISSTTALWQNYFQTWTSGATQTNANICITNQNTSVSGNDFGIDDIYFAQVCEFHDTVDVLVHNYPIVNLGNDTSLCIGDSLTFNITADSISTFLWQDSSTLSNYSAYQSDTIWLEVANSHCKSRDSMLLSVYPYPTVDLGADTLICNGTNVTLDATWNNASYLWQDGSTNSSYSVSSSGLYWVELDNHKCKASDSVNINISNGPNPNLGPDQFFCKGSSIVLDPGTWNTYLWSNGSTLPVLSVSPASTQSYSVIVWDQDGCMDSSEVELNPIPIPSPDISSDMDTVCLGRSVTIDASGGDNYLWNGGQTSSQINIAPRTSASYTVTVTNTSNGIDCSADTSIYIYTKDCNTLFIPNSFTPNNDGLNDTYGPKGEFDLEHYEMIIYDRFGAIIFYTTDVFEQWDGTNKKGEVLPSGVYTYLLIVKEPISEQYQLFGTVHLLR